MLAHMPAGGEDRYDQLIKANERELEKLRGRHAAEQEEHTRRVRADEKRHHRQLKDHDKSALNKMNQDTKRAEQVAKLRLKIDLADMSKADAKAKKQQHNEQLTAERDQAFRSLQTAIEQHGAIAAAALQLEHLEWQQQCELRQLEEEVGRCGVEYALVMASSRLLLLAVASCIWLMLAAAGDGLAR